MLKHKIRHLFFISLFLMVHHTVMGMKHLIYDDSVYVYPVISCTHNINRCFWNVFSLMKDSTESKQAANLKAAKQEISNCHFFIVALEKAIKNFVQFPQKRLISEFEALAKCSSDKEVKKIITTQIIPQLSAMDTMNGDTIYSIIVNAAIIRDKIKDPNTPLINPPQLASMNATKKIVDSIIFSLADIRDKLNNLNSPINTPNEFRTNLSDVMAQYESMFLRFGSTPTSNQPMHKPQGIMPTIISTASTKLFKDILSTPHQDIQNLLNEKNNIKGNLEIKPELENSPIKGTVTYITRITALSRIPFLERLFCWILNHYNELVKRLLGSKTYNNIKENIIFHYLRALHENKFIRVVDVHTSLNNQSVNNILEYIYQEKKSFADYCDNLQKYFCIELLECLHRSHNRSLEVLQREQQHFSFASEPEIVLDEQNKTNQESAYSNIQKRVTESKAFRIIKYAASTTNNIAKSLAGVASLSGIKNLVPTKFAEKAKLFFSSLSPWYQPETNIVPVQLQPSVIPAQQTLGIIDFLLAARPKINQKSQFLSNIPSIHTIGENLWGYDITSQLKITEENFVDNQPKINGKQLQSLENMIQAHKKLEQDKQDSFCKSEIDELYHSLTKLDEERKDLQFFNVWSKIVNQRKRDSITNNLQHHIAAYNMAKVNLYNKDEFYATTYSVAKGKSGEIIKESPYTKHRKEFLAAFPLSPKDRHDIFKLSTKNDRLKDCIYVFNPLERSEMRRLVI